MKRPARLVWCLVNESGTPVGVYTTKKAALAREKLAMGPLRVAGPYLLVERVREK